MNLLNTSMYVTSFEAGSLEVEDMSKINDYSI